MNLYFLRDYLYASPYFTSQCSGLFPFFLVCIKLGSILQQDINAIRNTSRIMYSLLCLIFSKYPSGEKRATFITPTGGFPNFDTT